MSILGAIGMRLARAEFEFERTQLRTRAELAERARLDTELAVGSWRVRAERAELELAGRQIRLIGAPVWRPTATPSVVLACDGGVIVGAVVHELRELAFGDSPPSGLFGDGDPATEPLVDDGWRAYCRMEGSGGGTVQWAQELHPLARAKSEVERMLGELAAAARARRPAT